MQSWWPIYAINTTSGAYKVYFLAFLPVLYAAGVIDLSAVGWLGALLVGAMMAGSLAVHRFADVLHGRTMLFYAALLAAVAATLLLWGYESGQFWCVVVAYITMGFATGVTHSSVGALAGLFSSPGQRFKKFAQLAMLKDVMRILVPLIIGYFVVLELAGVALGFLLLLVALALIASRHIPRARHETEHIVAPGASPHRNKKFLYASVAEFLDNFSSSTLFVFVPLIFLMRGYPIDESIYFQSVIFLGYLSGRWVLAKAATPSNGWRVVGISEFGMALCIALMLLATNFWVLIGVSFLLGVFTRGSSPVIKALTFDTLSEQEMKRGTALYSIIGDVGAISGQLVFGLLAAHIAIQAPFVASALVAVFVGFYCFARMPTWKRSS